MSCERYWREGVVLVERGLDDPHRNDCEDCRRAHASRQELIEALPQVGAEDPGDPHWQAKVWRRLEGERARAPSRWRWQHTCALALGCVVALWIGLGRTRSGDAPARSELVVQTRIDVIKSGVAMRSSERPGERPSARRNAYVGDRLQVELRSSSDVWIYRSDRLVLSCRARTPSVGCAPDDHGMVVELALSAPGTYQVIVVDAPGAFLPRGDLDHDVAPLIAAGVAYEEHLIVVR